MIRRLARLELRTVLNVGACGNLLPRRGVLRLEDQGAVVGGHRQDRLPVAFAGGEVEHRLPLNGIPPSWAPWALSRPGPGVAWRLALSDDSLSNGLSQLRQLVG
jgi:hypothetical protein